MTYVSYGLRIINGLFPSLIVFYFSSLPTQSGASYIYIFSVCQLSAIFFKWGIDIAIPVRVAEANVKGESLFILKSQLVQSVVLRVFSILLISILTTTVFFYEQSFVADFELGLLLGAIFSVYAVCGLIALGEGREIKFVALYHLIPFLGFLLTGIFQFVSFLHLVIVLAFIILLSERQAFCVDGSKLSFSRVVDAQKSTLDSFVLYSQISNSVFSWMIPVVLRGTLDDASLIDLTVAIRVATIITFGQYLIIPFATQKFAKLAADSDTVGLRAVYWFYARASGFFALTAITVLVGAAYVIPEKMGVSPVTQQQILAVVPLLVSNFINCALGLPLQFLQVIDRGRVALSVCASCALIVFFATFLLSWVFERNEILVFAYASILSVGMIATNCLLLWQVFKYLTDD